MPTDCQKLIRDTLAKKYVGAMSDEAAEYLARIDPTDVDARNTFIRMVDRPKFRDLAFEYWLSSILSAPPTHIRNIVGNTSYATAEVPTRATQGGIDWLLTAMRLKPEREVFAGEALHLAQGALSGIPAGVARAVKAFSLDPPGADLLTGKLGGLGGALEYSVPASARLQSPTARKVAGAVTLPLKALTAEDAFAKIVAAAAEEHAWAYRTARRAGLRGDALADRVTELLAERPEEMIDAGKALAAKLTFTDDPSWFARGLAGFRGAAGREAERASLRGNRIAAMSLGGADMLLKMTVPFINVPDRLIVRGLEFTPIGFVRGAARLPGARRAMRQLPEAEAKLESLRAAVRGPEDMAAVHEQQRLAEKLRASSSTVEATDLLARGTLGSAVAVAVGAAFANAQFTGPAPTDQAAREAFYASGKKPWAVKVGDAWIPFGRTDPLGNALGTIALFGNAFDELGDEESVYERASTIATQFGQMMLDKGTMVGISDLLEVFQTGGYGSAGDRLKTYLARQASGALPWSGALRTTAQMMDPGLVQREGPLDYVKESIPGVRGTMEPRLDRFGEQIQTAETNPIAQVLGRMFSTDPNRFAPLLASGTPLDISLENQDPVRRTLEEVGRRERGRTELDPATAGPIEREELEKLFASPGWGSLTERGKQIAIERARRRARERAQRAMGVR